MNNETKKKFTEFRDAFKRMHKEMYNLIDLGSCTAERNRPGWATGDGR